MDNEIKYITINIDKVNEVLYYDKNNNGHILRSGERHIIDEITPSIESLIKQSLIFINTITIGEKYGKK